MLKNLSHAKARIYATLGCVLGLNMAITGPAQAVEINAGYVLNEMSPDERVSYIYGVVEGLSYARFLRDRPDESGMLCVYNWLGQDTDNENWRKMRVWLARHPDKPVGVLMHVLIKQECGE